MRPNGTVHSSKTKREGQALSFILNADYNLNTNAEVVQKEVQTMTLIIFKYLSFCFFLGAFGATCTFAATTNYRFPFMAICTYPPNLLV